MHNWKRLIETAPLLTLDCTTTAGWTATNATLSVGATIGWSPPLPIPRSSGSFLLIARNDTTSETIVSNTFAAIDISGGAILNIAFYVIANTAQKNLTVKLLSANGGWLKFTPSYADGNGTGPSLWNSARIPISNPAYLDGVHWTTGGSFDPTDVITFQLSSLSGTTETYVGLDKVIIEPSATKATIVFLCDDGVNASLQTIMDSYGWPMGFGLIGTGMDSTEWAEARAAEALGHTMCNHGYNHNGMVDLTPVVPPTATEAVWTAEWEAWITNLTRMTTLMRANGCYKGSRICILPGGQKRENRAPFWEYLGVMNRFTDAHYLVTGPLGLENSFSSGPYWDGSLIPSANPAYSSSLSRYFISDTTANEARVNHLIYSRGLAVAMLHGLDGASQLTTAQFTALCNQIAVAEQLGLIEVLDVADLVYGPLPPAAGALTGLTLKQALSTIVDNQETIQTKTDNIPASPALESTAEAARVATASVSALVTAGAFTAGALANAPTGSTIAYNVQHTTIGQAPEVNLFAYQYCALGPFTITTTSSQQSKTHKLVVFNAKTPSTILWQLDNTHIAVSGSDYKTLTVTDANTNTGTTGTWQYRLINTTDSLTVSEGAITIKAQPNTST